MALRFHTAYNLANKHLYHDVKTSLIASEEWKNCASLAESEPESDKRPKESSRNKNRAQTRRVEGGSAKTELLPTTTCAERVNKDVSHLERHVAGIWPSSGMVKGQKGAGSGREWF